MLPLLARTLGVSVEELIGEQPKPRQRAVMDVIEAMLAQQSRLPKRRAAISGPSSSA